jgi:hypothetical protein
VSAPAQQTGEQIFDVNCARCHAAVEIDRRIRNDWADRPASQMFEVTRQTMPADAPGSLSEADYLEVLAYMLDLANVQRPAGELTAASLGGILLQAGASAGEGEDYPWRNIHGELNANRYSPLDQINADNAKDLKVVWRWKAGNYGPTPEIRSVNMPIMQDGRLYFAAGRTRNIVSLDAETGQTLWMWRPDEGERFAKAARKGSGMGVAYWEGDDGRRRVITVTPGYNLVSLNAATGLPDPEFGAGGWVDLTETSGDSTPEAANCCGPSIRFRNPVNPVTKPGMTARPTTPATRASGPRCSGLSTCPSKRRPGTTTAGRATARTYMQTASLPSITSPGKCAGTTSSSITTSGIWTIRPLQYSPTCLTAGSWWCR